jgi:ketopantoate hydroxymethyltransferase
MARFAQVFAPRDRVYFELFEEAGQNMLRASSLLYDLLSDYPSAQVAEEAGVDIVLVGDSGAMTVLGYPSTRATGSPTTSSTGSTTPS